MNSLEIGKLDELFKEFNFEISDGAIALFCNNNIGDPPVFVGRRVIFLAHQKHDDIRILLNGAGFTQVRKLRPMILPAFNRA